MSDRLAVMRRGKIEQLGEPETVYESPATEFVAGFLGASNLLDGELAGGDGMMNVRLSGGELVTIPAERIPREVDKSVKVGVRPEKISIGSADQDAPAGTNSVTGLLRMSTYIGVSHQYKIEMPGAHELTVYVQNLGAGPPPAPGEKVRLSWLPEHTFAVEPAAPISEQEEVE